MSQIKPMNSKLICILVIYLFSSYSSALAESNTVAQIIRQQVNQINDLKKRVAMLETAMAKITSNTHTIDSNNIPNSKDIVQNEPHLAAAEPLPHPSGVTPNTIHSQTILTANQSELNDDKHEYDLALAALKGGELVEAEQRFAQFIANHPTSTLQSHATFWYAETFYRNGEFSKAAMHYLQHYKKYPNSTKAPDALLKLAYALAHIQKSTEACNILDKLEHQFPARAAESADRIKEARIEFGC